VASVAAGAGRAPRFDDAAGIVDPARHSGTVLALAALGERGPACLVNPERDKSGSP